MAGKKISKTARASMLKKSEASQKSCPKCGDPLVATKLVKASGRSGGMFWVCSKDDTHIRI